MSEFYLLRHAESQTDRAVPDRDWPLSPRGRQQALELVPFLKRLDIEAIYSSPFRRPLDTIRPYAQAAGIDVV